MAEEAGISSSESSTAMTLRRSFWPVFVGAGGWKLSSNSSSESCSSSGMRRGRVLGLSEGRDGEGRRLDMAWFVYSGSGNPRFFPRLKYPRRVHETPAYFLQTGKLNRHSPGSFSKKGKEVVARSEILLKQVCEPARVKSTQNVRGENTTSSQDTSSSRRAYCWTG